MWANMSLWIKTIHPILLYLQDPRSVVFSCVSLCEVMPVGLGPGHWGGAAAEAEQAASKPVDQGHWKDRTLSLKFLYISRKLWLQIALLSTAFRFKSSESFSSW